MRYVRHVAHHMLITVVRIKCLPVSKGVDQKFFGLLIDFDT
jgi:hypothetical protein